MLLHDTDSDCSLIREQGAAQVAGCYWNWCWSNGKLERINWVYYWEMQCLLSAIFYALNLVLIPWAHIFISGVEIFSLRTIFAQFSLSHRAAAQQLIDLKKVRTESLKFRTSRSNNEWLLNNAASDCSQRLIAKINLQIENRSSSCQCWSIHGFQASHFICDQFGYKLWLRFIQNHARHRF